jgi:hypothetical protein
MKLWGLVIGVAGLSACGGGDEFAQRTCTPGVTQECVCPGGAMGAQACSADGNGYAACQCSNGSGSGGSAGAGQAGSGSGGTAGAGGSGTGGAAGSCAPRSICPAPPEDGGTQLCGMLDDYCGGKLSCGCEFGECAGGACQCARIGGMDATCVQQYARPIAMQCATSTVAPPNGCVRAGGGWGFPANSFCCAR